MNINYDILYNSKKFIQIRKDMHISVSDYFKKKCGYIYLAKSRNNSLMKIGRTAKNPLERAESLETTGVLYEYEIVFALPVLNQFWAESQVHQKLKKFRFDKEFFAVNQQLAIDTMGKVYVLEEHLLKRYFNIDLLKKDYYDIEKALK